MLVLGMSLLGMRGMRELHARLSLLGFLSDVLLVVLPLFVLVLLLCLSFGFRRRPNGIGRAAFFGFYRMEGFRPTCLYKRRLCTLHPASDCFLQTSKI
jgi:hypothetical protein